MDDTQPTLLRALGRWDLVGIVINATIGAGILGLPGKAYALLGPYSLVAVLAGGVIVGLVGACYAEAGSRFSSTGGTYLYAYAAFGRPVGAIAGWAAILTRLMSFAAISNLAILYAAGLYPPIATGLPRIVALSVLTGALTVLVYRGVRLSGSINNGFTLCKLIVLMGFVAIGLPMLLGHGFALTPPPAAANWSPAIVLLLFGLIGLEAGVINGGEMRDPRRDLPFAIAVGVATVMVVYLLVFLVCFAVVPDLATSKKPIFDGMVRLLGPVGGVLFALGGIATMLGTLFAHVFVGPRQFLALAENVQFPAAIGAIHPVFRTPHRAVLLTGAICWCLAVGSSFLGALVATTYIRLLIYLLTCCAVPVLRRRHASETALPLLLPGGMVVPVAAACGCLWVVLQAGRNDLLNLAVSLLPGVALAWIYRRRSTV